MKRLLFAIWELSDLVVLAVEGAVEKGEFYE